MPLSKVIAKSRPEFPELDFDILRAEGIRHLENFATELWTDYNAHDPGITLLELLCYAITDLGYRTRMLSLEDILSRPSISTNNGVDQNSGNTAGENTHIGTSPGKEWFTAAEVLPTGPVTRLDYRKWMIDAEGVKNAWVRPALYRNLRSECITFPVLEDQETEDRPLRQKCQVIFDTDRIKELLRECQLDIIAKAEELQDANNASVTSFLFSEEDDTSSSTPDEVQLLIDLALLEAVAEALNAEIKEKAAFPAIRRYVDQLNAFQADVGTIAKSEIADFWVKASDPIVSADIDRILEILDRPKGVDSVLPVLDDDLGGDRTTRLWAELEYLLGLSNFNGLNDLLSLAVDYGIPELEVVDFGAEIADISLPVGGVASNGEEYPDITANEVLSFLAYPSEIDILEEEDPKLDPGNDNFDPAAWRTHQILDAALALEELSSVQDGVVRNRDKIYQSSAQRFLLSTEYSSLISWYLGVRTPNLLAEYRTEIENYLKNTEGATFDIINGQGRERFYLLNLIRSFLERTGAELSNLKDFLKSTSRSNRPVSEFGLYTLLAFRSPVTTFPIDYWPNSNLLQALPSGTGIPSFTQDHLRSKRQRLVQDYYKNHYTHTPDGVHTVGGTVTGDNAVFEELMDFLLYEFHLQERFANPEFKNEYFTKYNNKWASSKTIGISRFLADVFPDLEGVKKKKVVGDLVRYLGGEENNGSDSTDDDDVNTKNAKAIAEYIMKEKFCEYGRWKLEYREQPAPNDEAILTVCGLYQILLDLDEDIDTGIPNQVTPIIKLVKDRLHKNRGLCEDYASISIIQQRPIHLCINLEVASTADEIEVMAKAIKRMQEYLSPVPRFRTFKQRLTELQAAGKNCSAEVIYNGPCMENGFLVDEELGQEEPRHCYYHSDLLREIMSVDGVIGLPELKVKPIPEDEAQGYQMSTFYEVYGGDYPDPRESENVGASFCKPVIDLSKSFIQIKKGVRTYEINSDQVADQLQLLRLTDPTDPFAPIGGPEWNMGTYRPDLSTHRSLQYDLPNTYLVGDNPPPAQSTSKRKAQSKQLQAFLAFFDQILASYLHQLGRVRELLSVDQNSTAPNWVLPLMYDMPGLRDLIGHDTPFTATPTDWNIILQDIRDDLTSISKGQGNTAEASDRALAEAWIADFRAEETEFAGFLALRDELKAKLSTLSLPDLAAGRFSSLYLSKIEQYFWTKFQATENNQYVQRMAELSESSAEQQNRKNRLLDHLLARFGESFSEFATTLLRPEAEPEDNPRQQSFEDYLKAKTEFLQEIADLAKGRSLGYNYLAYRDADNAADVWNTLNVSGVQRRVVRKLGMSNWETRSLNTEPNYRIDRVRRTNRRGMANFRAALRRRTFDPDDNPMESTPLMTSPAYNSPRLAQDKINELYRNIWEAEFREETDTVPENEDFYWYRLLPGRGGKFRAALYKYNPSSRKKVRQGLTEADTVNVDLLLQSELLSEDEARNRILDEIIPLTRLPQTDRENEGFHIVEHILLRPLEEDDPLLQLSLGCVPEETPKDPYTFWLTVIVPADTTRFADPDFRGFFEHTFREELPAHIAPRFCYLDRELMYEFEELYAIWMFEKAKCDPPNYCREDVARANLVELLNRLPCGCGCGTEEREPKCE